MSTITSILGTDLPSNSRAVINTNFSNLNTDKAELASPAFTGTPSLPTGTTAVTQTIGDSTTKVATTAFVQTALSTISFESSATATHSLTTTAGQVVCVWAKGDVTGAVGNVTVTLAYNGVAKDTIAIGSAADTGAFSLMYTETPGAATQNITLTVSGGASISTPVIIVQKVS